MDFDQFIGDVQASHRDAYDAHRIALQDVAEQQSMIVGEPGTPEHDFTFARYRLAEQEAAQAWNRMNHYEVAVALLTDAKFHLDHA